MITGAVSGGRNHTVQPPASAMMSRPSAVVTVRLVDVSLADAPAMLIAEQVITTAGRQVPFEFALAYDASRIEPSHTYAVQVRIENGDRLLFISDKMNLVITRDAPTHLDIVVRRT